MYSASAIKSIYRLCVRLAPDECGANNALGPEEILADLHYVGPMGWSAGLEWGVSCTSAGRTFIYVRSETLSAIIR